MKLTNRRKLKPKATDRYRGLGLSKRAARRAAKRAKKNGRKTS